MKEEFSAHDMATAAADGFRDGQRAALDHSAQSFGLAGALVTALDGLLSITQESAGVAGYHLNGNVAEWNEFPEVSTAQDVLNLYRERADKPCFFGIDLAQGALDAGPWRDAIIDQGWTPPGQQQASDKVPCKTHPDAPHGFCRNSSHTEGRYVCECEHWEEPQASSGQSAPAGEREAFEAWANGRCELHLVNQAGRYSSATTQFAFEAFQAGAAWQRTQSAGVPVKPTQAMISAGWKVGLMGMDRDGPQAIWAAMLAAAPAQPAAQEQGEVQRLLDWIACAERLPADKRDVMVYCADSDEHMVGSSIGGGLFLFATASHGEKVVCRPTHWRYIDESDKPDLDASTGQKVKP